MGSGYVCASWAGSSYRSYDSKSDIERFVTQLAKMSID